MNDRVRTLRCPAILDDRRCDFTGTPADVRAHADEVRHARCLLCEWPLRYPTDVCCVRCVTGVRDDLTAIVAGVDELERRIADGAYSGGWLPALTLVADGNLGNLRPWRDVPVTTPVTVEHVELRGADLTHAAYVERRSAPDGREHFADHWRSDPVSVLAVLEVNERDWRNEFGHGPAVTIATVENCAGYLRTWLWLAAKTHPGFDEFAAEMRGLRSLVEHVALLIADPDPAPVPCACGGRLEQRFGDAGRSDDRVCRACGTTYDAESYLWRYRMATEVAGWVSVERAAEVVDRSEATVWAWQRALKVPSACSLFTRRVVVELEAVQAKSEATPRVGRRCAS